MRSEGHEARGSASLAGRPADRDPWADRPSGHPPAPRRAASDEACTVQSNVYDALRGALMRGRFAAGERLRVQAVAERMGVSAMPVREALARLASERALEALPNRSARVPALSLARLDDLARARALVEGEAVALAAPRLVPADLDALAALAARYDRALAAGGGAAGPGEAADLNHAFHARLYAAAGSEVLVPIIESLWLQSGPYVRAAAEAYGDGGALPATHHHHAILAALRAGDAGAARAALVADIGFAFDLLRGRLPPEGAA